MSILITSGGGVVTLGGGVATRGLPYALQWEHDGVDVDAFVLSIDGVETNLGALTPITGHTYWVALPASVAGTHAVIVYAVHGEDRTPSLEATITW